MSLYTEHQKLNSYVIHPYILLKYVTCVMFIIKTRLLNQPSPVLRLMLFKEEGTVSANFCPRIQKFLKSHENTHTPSWIRVYINHKGMHFYLVSKNNFDFSILAYFYYSVKND